MIKIKFVFSIFFVLLFLFLIKQSFGQIKIIHNSIQDTIEISATEINRIDYKFQIAINYHLLFLNHNFSYKDKQNNFIWISIEVPFPKRDDSIFNLQYSNFDFSKFRNFDFDPSYRVIIGVVNKKSHLNFGYSVYKKVYYLKYDDWNVIFVTNLPIEFSNIGLNKTLQLSIPKVDNQKNILSDVSIYEISNYNVIQIVYNLVHGFGSDYNAISNPYLSPYCLSKKFLSKAKIRRIKSKLNYP